MMSPRPPGCSVFLVEDEVMIRMMVADMLEELGYSVAAEAGEIGEAVRLAQSTDFDLAILDVNVNGKVIDAGIPKNTVINVNFPACAPDKVKGIRVTWQGKRNLGFLKVDKRHDGRGNPYFWIGFERTAMMDAPAEGTDLAALAASYVSVTPLRLDRTDEAFSEALTTTLK